eukprot:gene3309-1644_t
MNSCRCIACYSSPSLCYRELPYCHCETVHYTRVPQVINPIRTRPVLYKAPVATIALPQSILMRNSERSIPQSTPRAGQTKLKFGIDSILGKDTSESVRQDHLESSTTKLQHDVMQPKYTKHSKVMPPKRAVFSDYQRRQLEVEFLAHKYISKQERRLLAKRLELSESQVRIWFQNRRMKWRNRQEREMMRRQRANPLKP